MVVLAELYQVQPWPELLADLTLQQQVHAALLADMWQLKAASDAAVEVLQTATSSEEKAPTVFEHLASLAAPVPDCLLPVIDQTWPAALGKYRDLKAVPGCLLPVFEQALLRKFCDLDDVWGPSGATLQGSLLVLPRTPWSYCWHRTYSR
jgi:hypothetical protein